MVIRNGISSGYPFIEAIKSALPMADEFLISEGYSTDGTYEVLERCFQGEEKIKLYRNKWDEKSVNGSALTNALNNIRYKCKYEYIFEVDANEIIPSESLKIIKNLPQTFPKIELFGLPYYQIMGSKILFTEEFRYRLAKNFSDIKALNDGNTLGYRYTIFDLKNRRTLRRIKSKFTSMAAEGRSVGLPIPEEIIYLSNPIFKYYSIFPENYFQKMKTKTFLQPSKDYSLIDKDSNNSPFKEIYSQYKEDGDYDLFWDKIYDLHIQLSKKGVKINKEFREKRIIDEKSQPDIIRNQFGREKYEPICH